MKTLFTDLAAYQLWADRRLLEAIAALPPGTVDKEVASSFPTLRATFEHLLWAGRTWLRRLEMQEGQRQAQDFEGGFAELSAALVAVDEHLAAWTSARDPSFFEQPVAYYNSQKQYFRMPVWQCLMQLFNHETYHRGQVVTMLHQLGVTTIPATDYIIFKRSPGMATGGTTGKP